MSAAGVRPVTGWTLAIAVLALTGACGYQPGSFRSRLPSRDFAAARATVGCLDVAVAGRWDAARTDQVVEIDFGNRCDRPVVVDFTSLRAAARDAGGREYRLIVYDPGHEIRPLGLEARSVGREVLELRPADDAPLDMRAACVDVGLLAGGPAPPRWLCIERPRGAVARRGEP